MEQITTVGIDLAKNVFPLHGDHAASRRCCSVRCNAIGSRRWWLALPPCLIGMEACGSA